MTDGRAGRRAGAGPATWTTWSTGARPRSLRAWGALPGAYLDSVGDRVAGSVRGAKQESLMRFLVSDSSREGDLILDPCAGGGTTGVAAKQPGRQCIMVEMDPKTAALAAKRLAGARRQLPLPICGDGMRAAKPTALDFDADGARGGR